MMILSQYSYSFSSFSTIYFFFFVSLIFHSYASPKLQRDALLEFKNEFPISASNPNDPSLSSWNTSSSDHCSWKGVTCDGKSGEVISLDLNIPLNGSLKPNTSLLKLQHLRHLTLFACNLIGEIPSSLGNFHHLINLDLSYNQLLGEVPTSIGNLNQLALLNLASNNLSGNIPTSFANLNKLTDLDLSENLFTSGDFSTILSNLTSLSRLHLNLNHIKSKLPDDMSGLHNLEDLDVSGNSFFGNFPTSLFTLPSLYSVSLRKNQFNGLLEFGETFSFNYLDLAHNNFNGQIPKSISRLVNLIILDLSSNSLIGTIPDSTSRLVNLTGLHLSHNNLIGTIPLSMSKLVSLSTLDLSYNKLEGQIPSFLWSLSSLTLSHNSFTRLEKSFQVVINGNFFDLGSNSLQGPFPQWICNSTSLGVLDLSNNHLTGSIPTCLKNSTISSLIYMNLRNNNFTGVLPDIFIGATVLRSLDVSRNLLVGKLPKSLMKCSNMEFLNLKGNNIKDTFPFWLQSLESLHVLLLRSNAFYGKIYSSSTSFGFPALRVIDISHNSFNGTLPQDYFVNWLEMSSVSIDHIKWYQSDGPYLGGSIVPDSMDIMYKGVETEFSHILLEYKGIDFSGNKFEGRIPKSVGMLKGLRLLNLSANAFTDNIPSSLGNITNLEALDLSRNKLSGRIPHDLGKLSFLSYLDFSHNLLQGPVPGGTQFQRQNCSSFEDNLGLYGLKDICGEIHIPDTISQQHEDFSSEPEEMLNWIAAAIAYVPGVFCGLVIGHIFTSRKHEWFLEKFGRKRPRRIINVR